MTLVVHTHTSEWNYEISHQLLVQVPLFSTEHSKGKILALSQELRWENKCNG